MFAKHLRVFRSLKGINVVVMHHRRLCGTVDGKSEQSISWQRSLLLCNNNNNNNNIIRASHVVAAVTIKRRYFSFAVLATGRALWSFVAAVAVEEHVKLALKNSVARERVTRSRVFGFRISNTAPHAKGFAITSIND